MSTGIYDYLPEKSSYSKEGPYLTGLTSDEEKAFQAWVKQNKVPFDPSPVADYDMRGFWKGLMSGDPRARTEVNASDEKLHFSDTWKTPFHKTFSNESIYATPEAPHWEKGKLIDADGNIVADESGKAIRWITGLKEGKR